MNFVFLSPHFPPNYYHFIERLANNGINVFGIADTTYDQLSQELSKVLSEYYRVESMLNYDELLRACGFLTHKYGKIDRIESLNEYWLETEAQLRTDFNVYGKKSNEIREVKFKSEMKKVFMAAGITVAKGKICQDLEEASRFIEEIGYPVIAKPNNGVGADQTYKIYNRDDLNKFFSDKLNLDYIFEEFIDGTIVTFDGLTDQNGEIVFSTSHVYSQGVMEIVNNDDNVFYYSLRKIPGDLRNAGHKIINVFNLRERFFHLEFFRTKIGKKLVAIEINMRPPGGMTTDMFNYANDIDIYNEWANVVKNNEFSANYSRDYHCAFIGRKFNRQYNHTHEEILNKFGDSICHHEEIHGVFRTAMGDYGYIVRSPKLNEIKNIVNYIQLPLEI